MSISRSAIDPGAEDASFQPICRLRHPPARSEHIPGGAPSKGGGRGRRGHIELLKYSFKYTQGGGDRTAVRLQSETYAPGSQNCIFQTAGFDTGTFGGGRPLLHKKTGTIAEAKEKIGILRKAGATPPAASVLVEERTEGRDTLGSEALVEDRIFLRRSGHPSARGALPFPL